MVRHPKDAPKHKLMQALRGLSIKVIHEGNRIAMLR